MGFTDTIVLFENFNEPLDAFKNNVPTIAAQAKIDLDSDQFYTFSRIFAQVCYPPTTFGAAFRLEFNGKTLGSKTWGAWEGGCKSIDVPVTDFMKGTNTLKFHLDGRLQPQEAQLYADLFYELNTPHGPKSVEVGDPGKESELKNTIILIGAIGGSIAVAGIVLNAFLMKQKPLGFSRPLYG